MIMKPAGSTETSDTSGRKTSGRYLWASPAFQPTPQDDQPMSKNRIRRLKPALRLERWGQHGQNKPNQRDHRANLADSIIP
jgi:hypothetical protein